MNKTRVNDFKRAELLMVLTDLSDMRYQEECWVKRNCPPGSEYDSVHVAMEYLLDETRFLDSPVLEIGNTVYNYQEAVSVAAVSNLLHLIVATYGDREVDNFYIELKEWKEVVERAKTALEIFMRAESER
jgi:hypothetical protein